MMKDEDILEFYCERSQLERQDRPRFDRDVCVENFVCKYYNYVSLQGFTYQKDKNLSDSVFEVLLSKLENDKCPGAPWCFFAPTNGVLKDNFCSEFRSSVDERLRKLIKFGEMAWKTREEDDHEFSRMVGHVDDFDYHVAFAKAILSNGLADPSLLKIKGEPRKKGKKPRLVNMVSAVTNTLWRVALNDAMMDEQERDDLPIATALDLNSPHKTQAMYETFKSHGKLTSSDIQGWEYANRAHTHWVPFVKWVRVMNLADERWVVLKHDHFHLLFALYLCDLHRVLQTGNGLLICTSPGMVTSGKLLTFSDGSCMRAYLSYLVALIAALPPPPFIKTAGDDDLDTNPDLTVVYKDLGYVVTDVLIQSAGRYDFCSTVFLDGFSYQENLEKFFVNMLFNLNEGRSKFLERMVAFENYRHHPEYRYYKNLLRCVEPREE